MGLIKVAIGSLGGVLAGSLGQSILQTFATKGRRFTFGAEPAKDQRVYYFNTKELLGNKYGTPSPVPFRIVDENIGLDMDMQSGVSASIPTGLPPPCCSTKTSATQAAAMQASAKNGSGAMTGFMGMAGAAGGFDSNQLFQMGQQPASAPADGNWICGTVVTGNFCRQCGAKRPNRKPDGWVCHCGSVNKGKFCPECGDPFDENKNQ